MSEPADTNAVDKGTAPALPMKPSAMGGALRFLIPALLAAAASYGGARAAAARGAVPAVAEQKAPASPPGPTVALDPFLVTIQDANKKGHAMKVSLAVEFSQATKEELLKPFSLRIRDAILTYVRTLSYEDATNGAHMAKLRADLLERCHAAGATTAERILITDLVIQ